MSAKAVASCSGRWFRPDFLRPNAPPRSPARRPRVPRLGIAHPFGSPLGEQQAPLSQLVAGYSRYAASGEINSEVADQAGRTAAVRAVYEGQPGVTIDDLDGMTVTGDGWWFNLRPSNTEPLLRLYVEAQSEAATKKLVKEASDWILKA